MTMPDDFDVGERMNVFAIRPPREQLIDHMRLVKQYDQLRELRPAMADELATVTSDLIEATLVCAEQLGGGDPDWLALSVAAKKLERALNRIATHGRALAKEVLALP